MIIDKSINKECRKCKGCGAIDHYIDYIGEVQEITCEDCNGTGIYKDEYYIIVANGIAFDSDTRGK